MPYHNGEVRSLEESLGFHFNDSRILTEALVHRSFLNENSSLSLNSYERLEYLGDAFLGWIIAMELFNRYPDFPEGSLTIARSQLVRGESLAKIARRINLGAYLLIGQGEEKSGGRDRDSNLAAALESLLAAVLIDQGKDQAHSLIIAWMEPELDSFPQNGPTLDSKSNLQEIVQERGLPSPIYSVSEQKGSDKEPIFKASVLVDGEIIATGVGRRKSQAEQQAAFNALYKLKFKD